MTNGIQAIQAEFSGLRDKIMKIPVEIMFIGMIQGQLSGHLSLPRSPVRKTALWFYFSHYVAVDLWESPSNSQSSRVPSYEIQG